MTVSVWPSLIGLVCWLFTISGIFMTHVDLAWRAHYITGWDTTLKPLAIKTPCIMKIYKPAASCLMHASIHSGHKKRVKSNIHEIIFIKNKAMRRWIFKYFWKWRVDKMAQNTKKNTEAKHHILWKGYPVNPEVWKIEKWWNKRFSTLYLSMFASWDEFFSVFIKKL